MNTQPTNEKKKVQDVVAVQVGDAVFAPLQDGTFLMLNGDRDDPNDNENNHTHVPRSLALRNYPRLTTVHNVVFGLGKWGLSLPLSYNEAPVGTTAIRAETLRERSFEDLLDFILVLTELEVILKGEKNWDTSEEACATRREGRDLILMMLDGMADMPQALAFCIADQLEKLEDLMKKPAERDAATADRIRELCTLSKVPL